MWLTSVQCPVNQAVHQVPTRNLCMTAYKSTSRGGSAAIVSSTWMAQVCGPFCRDACVLTNVSSLGLGCLHLLQSEAKVKPVFELFAKGGGACPVADIGTIVRSQGLCPTEKDVADAVAGAGICKLASPSPLTARLSRSLWTPPPSIPTDSSPICAPPPLPPPPPPPLTFVFALAWILQPGKQIWEQW
jgi:hypothetical protein